MTAETISPINGTVAMSESDAVVSSKTSAPDASDSADSPMANGNGNPDENAQPTPDGVPPSDPERSPDIFDDSSPTNVSRYGRARKQKLIADFYVAGPGSAQTPNGRGERSPSKTPPETGDARRGRRPKRRSNGADEEAASKRAHPKAYAKKDLIQRKEDKEETVDILRSMFSPPKAESVASPAGSDAFILKFDDEDAEAIDGNGLPEIGPVSLTDVEMSCGWEIGELAWARVGGHPMWPCLVTKDPFAGVYARKKLVGRATVPSFALHVTFFGDNGRHCWLVVNFLMRFTGLDDFNKIKMSITPEMRKKDPKYCASFEIKENKKAKWLAAVTEAEMLLRRPPEMREELAIMFFSPVNKAPKKAKKGKKDKLENGNVSLSESLFDSLFDDNQKIDESDEKKSPENKNVPVQPGMKKNIKKSKLKNQSVMDGWLLKPSSPADMSADADKPDKETSEDESAAVRDETLTDSQKLNNNDVSLNADDGLENGECKKKTVSLKLKKIGKRISVQERECEESPEKPVSIKKRRKLESDVSAKIADSVEIPMDVDTSSDVVDVNGLTKKIDNKYDDPLFQSFFVASGDCYRDDNPDMDDEGFLSYIYQIWQYSGDGAPNVEDKVKAVNQIKGMAENVPSPPKRTKRLISNDIPNGPLGNREKSTRKSASNAYFYEGSSDSYDSDKEQSLANKSQNKDNLQLDNANNELITNGVDVYMESLRVPKPNIYKGLSKEKVCEICESPGNLVKCKGHCQGMFHISCCEKQLENKDVENKLMVKAKKKRGRPKVKRNDSTESEGNSENSETINGSQELNICDESAEISINQSNKIKDVEQSKYDENAVIEPVLNGEVDIPPSPEQPCSPKTTNSSNDGDNLENKSILDSVVDFESQMSQKILELMKRSQSPDDETASHSSYDDVDWKDIKAGECVIVEPKKKLKKSDIDPNVDPNDQFKCNHCTSNKIPLCFVCKSIKSPKSDSEIRQRCNVIRCHQYYHPDCLKEWPQTKYTTGSDQTKIEIMSCPRHVCHNCVSDDPQGCKTRFSGDKLARCVRCPATYHSFTQCTPAGTRLITASQIVCPRHCDDKSAKMSYHVNTAWCFICAKGGTLVCCETCPTSFHAECLNVPLPEGGYICEDCETGRLPLYEELVWVKLGQYRWWPALILHPSDIPPNIMALPHQSGQFAVRFFGIYDHYWVNSGRVFPYQEGDTGHASSKKSSVDTAFLTAVKQAQEAYVIIKELKDKGAHNELKSSLLPPKYVKLKVNRPIGGTVLNSKGGESSKCDCNPDAEFPCSPDSDCLNRMLLTECSPNVCAAGTRCCNQYFEKRLYPPLQPSRTSERGWGLKILADVKKGDFLIEYVGEVIDEAEFQRRMSKRQELRDENYYFLTLDKDRMIDAGPKGNFARFMNHSCEPNCETQKWTVNGDTRVGLFALKDISAGSELTFNYNLVCAGDDKKKCLCGTKRCAGYIGAKPKQDDPLPKKQKKVKLKRKYRKRVQNNQNASTSKSPRPRGRPSGSRLSVNPDIQGIDRDVEIIKESLIDYYADDGDEDKMEGVFKPEINYDEPISFDTDETKIDTKIGSGKKKGKKYRGVKRKRITKVNFRTKSIKINKVSSNNSSPDAIHIETETDDNEKLKIVKVEAEDIEQTSEPIETEVKLEKEPKEETSN